MTLTQQFLVISIFPLSFIGMIVYLIRARIKRKQLALRWFIALLITAVWASSILRFYIGTAAPDWLSFSWGILGRYALSLASLTILWTTSRHLTLSRAHTALGMLIGFAFGVTAFLLDPIVWTYNIYPIYFAGQSFSSFDLWGAIWITSWLVPILASWILTRYVVSNLPTSLYRNQIHYWEIALGLFIVGGLLSSIQQTAQPSWQGLGMLLIIIGATIATVSIGRRQLPDLQVALRQLLHRLSGTLIIFGLTWLALTALNRTVADLPSNSGQELIFIAAAAAFAMLFTLVYRFVNQVTSRIFLRPLPKHDMVMSDYANAIGNLPEPKQLAQLFLRTVQANLGTDDGWFFTTEDGPAGRLIIRPLAELGTSSPGTVDFSHDSAFAQHLRENRLPLIQHDIDSLPAFDEMSKSDKALLVKWQRNLYMPLHAGDSLVGLLAMGAKYSGEAYDRTDFEALRLLAIQISPLLAQAQNLTSLNRINHYVFDQNQTLARDRQHLQELARPYKLFFDMVSPEMREPFAKINRQIQKLQDGVAEAKSDQVRELGMHIGELRHSIDNLITMSARIQKRSNFHFERLQLNEVAGAAIRNLRTMADARKVKVDFEPHVPGAIILGDRTQLTEATQHLLHNAIKFNKIGGEVKLQCGVSGGEVYLLVKDSGVGIPEDRLQGIWSGFAQMPQRKNGSQHGSRGPGLGLALTHFVVSAHSGRVEASSEYGTGSAFSFMLPLILDD